MFKTCRVIFCSGADSDAGSVGNGAGICSGAKIGNAGDIGSGAGIDSGTDIGNGADIDSGAGIGSCAANKSGTDIGSGADIGSDGGIGSGAGSIYAFLFKICFRRVVSSFVAALTTTQTVSAMVQAS